MHGDGEVLAGIERSGSKTCQQFSGWVMCYGHFVSSNRALSRVIANRILDLTVPKGILRAFAISGCGRSSMNDSRIAIDCSCDRLDRALAIRPASSFRTIMLSTGS